MRYILVIALLPLLLLTACENTSGPRFEGDVYTVAGLLQAGKPIDLEHPVYIARSASIEDFNPWELFVAEATVLVSDMDTNEGIELQPTLHDFKVKWIDPLETVIQPGHRYRLQVEIPGYDKVIWAETTVPQTVELEADPWGSNPAGTGYSHDPASTNTTPFSAVDSQYPLVVNTGSNAGTFNFVGEVWCLEDFSTDLEFTTPVFGVVNPPASLENVYNSGGAFRRVNFTYRLASQPQPGISDNYIVLNNYSFAFVLYGRYRVSAYIVDDNYFRYRYIDEGYFHGGIHNALGYFGSSSGGEMYINIVK